MVDAMAKKNTYNYDKLVRMAGRDAEALKLVFWGGNANWDHLILKDEEKEFIKQIRIEYNKKYKWTEIPIEVVEGVKEYSVRAEILTNEEYLHKMNSI